MTAEERTVSAFTRDLASTSPAPGGGGAAALAGALAAALVSMAAGISSTGKKHAVYREELEALADRTEELSRSMLACIDRDAEAFLPLAAVYRSDRNAPDFTEKKDRAARTACEAPQELIRLCGEVCDLLEQLQANCSASLLSDVGCAAALDKAAVQCAEMNVYVNVRLITGDPSAAILREETALQAAALCSRLDAVQASVLNHLRLE